MSSDRRSQPGSSMFPSSGSGDKNPATRRPLSGASGASWKYTFSSLANRDFFYLWLGMLAMFSGIQIQMIARSYLTYELTSSPLILGVVNSGFAIPLLGFSLFGGAVADRLERKYIIQVGQLALTVLAFLVGLAILMNVISWYHLFFASILQGTLFAFVMPARQAIIGPIVGKENVSNAMALNASAMSGTTLMAPAIAGWAYAYMGAHNVYFLIASLALIGFLLMGKVHKTGTTANKSSSPVIRDIGEGLVYVWRSPIVLVLILMGLATALLAMPFRFMLPVFVVDVYRLGPDAMGLLVSIMGGGSLAGSLFIASVRKSRRGMLLILGSFISGITLLLLALIPIYAAAAFLMVFLGIGDAARRTLNQSLIMEEVEDQYRGRVMSVFMINFGLMPLGVLPAGAIAEAMGGQFAVGLLALLLLGVTALIFITQKRLREMP